jgi:hypothetical protein
LPLSTGRSSTAVNAFPRLRTPPALIDGVCGLHPIDPPVRFAATIWRLRRPTIHSMLEAGLRPSAFSPRPRCAVIREPRLTRRELPWMSGTRQDRPLMLTLDYLNECQPQQAEEQWRNSGKPAETSLPSFARTREPRELSVAHDLVMHYALLAPEIEHAAASFDAHVIMAQGGQAKAVVPSAPLRRRPLDRASAAP